MTIVTLIIVLIILIILTAEMKKIWEILGLIRTNQKLIYTILKTYNMEIGELQKELKKLKEEVDDIENV